MPKKVSSTNNLQVLFPEIAEEWHDIKNGDILPKDVSPKSNKKFWFKCNMGHEWEAVIGNRTHKGSGCPYCKNKKLCESNSLLKVFPEVAKEWHPTKNAPSTPLSVLFGTHKKFWWLCSKGHEWYCSVDNRTFNKRNCPYCNSLLVCKENSIENLYPDIASEWDMSLNEDSLPSSVFAKSGKKFWWKCQQGHSWKASVCHRTLGGRGCPYCLYKTQEKVRSIFQSFLKLPFPKISPKFLAGQEYDGANEELRLAFEYDGEFHDKPHPKAKNPEKSLKKTKELDAKKDRLSEENGWTLIRIHHSKKDILEETILAELKKINLI